MKPFCNAFISVLTVNMSYSCAPDLFSGNNEVHVCSSIWNPVNAQIHAVINTKEN